MRTSTYMSCSTFLGRLQSQTTRSINLFLLKQFLMKMFSIKIWTENVLFIETKIPFVFILFFIRWL